VTVEEVVARVPAWRGARQVRVTPLEGGITNLGNLAANGEFGPAEERALLERYAGRATGEAIARLRLMRLASDLREAMWGLVQAGISRLEIDFAGYAARHFARFATRAAAPEVSGRLP